MSRNVSVSLCLGLLLFCGVGHAGETEGPRAYPDAESVQPLGVGARVPSVTVREVDGDPVDLAEVVRESGALLVFYRGGW